MMKITDDNVQMKKLAKWVVQQMLILPTVSSNDTFGSCFLQFFHFIYI